MFSVKFYTDNTLTYSITNLSFSLAYSRAVPTVNATNRWNILKREEALIQATSMLTGETMRIAWEDSVEGRSRSHILIMKEDTRVARTE